MNKFLAAIVAFLGDISPKVKSGLNWGVLAALVLALLNAVTPSDLAFLGKYEPLAWSLVPIVIAAVAAWAKTDSLREAGKAALAKADAEAAAAVETPAPPTA